MTEEVVYDAGALIAIDGRSETATERHRDFLASGVRVIVPAVVAAQAVRNPARQARLMLALRGARVVPFTRDDYAPVGRLLASSGTCDVVDAFVAHTAARFKAMIVSSDPEDMRHLVRTLGLPLPVLTP
jgi:predicted nucleic acid-binding protein